MRTTVRLPDDLMRDVKRAAAESGRSLTSLIEDALREALARRRESRRSEPVRLPTFRGTGVAPGVDLDDSAALLDLMERADDPD
ncbi:MAG TPA: CopG family transcriptional regulator [Gemmatimonadota bacterium]|nr:CopG family transcriptional regulator [Gemmatimonadota bacterium]